jgi:hypothetical protein
MSASVKQRSVSEPSTRAEVANNSSGNATKTVNKSNYHGFVAGVFSGIAKLSGMYAGTHLGTITNICYSWPSVRRRLSIISV